MRISPLERSVAAAHSGTAAWLRRARSPSPRPAPAPSPARPRPGPTAPPAPARPRRLVPAGALTVTALGGASFAALAALDHDGQPGRDPRVQIGSSPSANTSPAPSPTPSSQSAADCPDGQAPEVTEIGTVAATGN